MEIFLKFISFFVLLSVCACALLPSYFTKCSRNDPNLSECIKKNIQEHWPTFCKGDSKYHILQMDPLHVTHMHVKVDSNLYGNLTDGIVTGLSGIEMKEVKADLENKRFEFYYNIPVSSVSGKFDVAGKLLGLILDGQGTTNVTFVGGSYKFSFNYKLVENKGKEYIEIVNSHLTHDNIERIYFDNNFGHNNTLGKTLSTILNDNWRELDKEISGSVGDAIGEIMAAVLRQFFKRVPFNNFFADE